MAARVCALCSLNTLAKPIVISGNFLPGARGGVEWDEAIATAEIEVEDGSSIDETSGMVTVESTEMDMTNLDNGYQSDILKFFSQTDLIKSSPAFHAVDNQSIATENINSDHLIDKHQVSSVPTATSTYFTPYFLSVDEEFINDSADNHEQQLLAKYKSNDLQEGENVQKPLESKYSTHKSKRESASNGTLDSYEKSKPKHGDVFLHKMITTINKNPGQVIR